MAEVPIGGSAGQVLTKASADDYDLFWGDGGGGLPINPDALVPPGGNIGEVLTKMGVPSWDMDWQPVAGPFDDSHLVALDGSRPMVGPLFLLLAPPTVDEHAANKAYVDDSIAAIPVPVPFDDSHLLTLDGTRPMEAELILVGPPTVPLAATTKAYVDALVTGDVGSRLIGVIDASTGNCRFIPETGILPNPGPLPPANAATQGDYVMCEEAGLIPGGPAAGIIMNKGDWLFCTGTVWLLFEVGTGVGIITATDVIVIPAVLGLTNVQDVLEEIETLLGSVVDPTGLYLLLVGGTLTGMLVLPATVPTLPVHATNKQYVDDQLTARGLPPGGATGMVLAKNTNTSYDTNWIAIPDSLVFIGSTPPPNPEEGQLWWRDTDAELYIWYNDGTSSQWVPASTGSTNGLPVGGNSGDVLVKRSTNNFDAGWEPGGGGGPIGDYLPLTGGILTGQLRITGGPIPQLMIVGSPATIELLSQNYLNWGLGNQSSGIFTIWSRPGGALPPTTNRLRIAVPDGSNGITSTRMTLDVEDVEATGNIVVNRAATLPNHVVNKNYVDSAIASGSLYQGPWAPGRNDPDLLALPLMPPHHGVRYLCLTDDPLVPETVTANIPGLQGRLVSNGSYIIWDEPVNQWDLISVGGSLSKEYADTLYLSLSGGILIGPVTTDRVPALDNEVVTKRYVDTANVALPGPWVVCTNTLANLNTTALFARKINGGANIQFRGYIQMTTGIIPNNVDLVQFPAGFIVDVPFQLHVLCLADNASDLGGAVPATCKMKVTQTRFHVEGFANTFPSYNKISFYGLILEARL